MREQATPPQSISPGPSSLHAISVPPHSSYAARIVSIAEPSVSTTYVPVAGAVNWYTSSGPFAPSQPHEVAMSSPAPDVSAFTVCGIVLPRSSSTHASSEPVLLELSSPLLLPLSDPELLVSLADPELLLPLSDPESLPLELPPSPVLVEPPPPDVVVPSVVAVPVVSSVVPGVAPVTCGAVDPPSPLELLPVPSVSEGDASSSGHPVTTSEAASRATREEEQTEVNRCRASQDKAHG